MLRKQISLRLPWFTASVVALALSAATALAEPFWTETANGRAMRGKVETLPDFVDLAARLSPAVVNVATEQKNLPRVDAPPEDESGDGPPGQPFIEDDPAHPRSLGSGFIISAGGFILPNDRVDVVRVYRDDEATKARGAEVMGSQTILANVRILAIGQNVQEENGKKVVTGGNATLELDPSQAELIVLAQHTGGSNLHLVLRSLVDSGGSTETVGDLENGKGGGMTIMRFGAAMQAAR